MATRLDPSTAAHASPAGGSARSWLRRWFPFAALLTLTMFGWLGWHAYSSYQTGYTIKSAYVRSEELRDFICRLQQQMLVASVQAVGTGRQEWITRYGRLERSMNRAIVEALNTVDPGHDEQALSDIVRANEQLRETEHNALALAADGHHDEGLDLLNEPAYQGFAEQFTAAATTFIENYRNYVDHRLRYSVTTELWSLFIAFVIFAVSTLVWLYLAWRLERWRAALEREVIERQRAEERLIQSQKMEAVGQLASGVAHDFNNVLTAINGYIALAKNKLSAGHPAVSDIDKLSEAANQARAVTRSLLTFSRRSEPEKRPVNLRRLLVDSEGLIKGMLPAAMPLQIVARDDLYVDGDRNQLVQALLNLAINARDAMSEGGRLRIELDAVDADFAGAEEMEVTGPVARIRVIDNGSGMSEIVRERALEPFFTTKPRGQGTGLGLPVVHGIVTAHGGRVLLDSVPGEGTTVTLLLPTIPPAEDITEGKKPEGIGQPAESATVLVAEDHRYVRDLVNTALRTAGYEVIEAGDGPALMAGFDEGTLPVDLAIIDADLPGKGGLECLSELRARGITIPAIVITGMVDEDLEERLQGRAMLLRKPFEIDELTRIVQRRLQARDEE
jgi:signal transduction histidine kinase/CheY-like chemotaxis protein